VKALEDRVVKAEKDAAHFSDELHQERDHASQLEKTRHSQENQIKDMQARLDEAEAAALKGGKKTIQKLEQQVRDIEIQLDGEQRHHAETQKSVRKQERMLKELALQSEEENKVHAQGQASVDTLQQKLKTYKRQVEEAVSTHFHPQYRRLLSYVNIVDGCSFRYRVYSVW